MDGRRAVTLTFREQIAQLRGCKCIDVMDGRRRFDPRKAETHLKDGIGFLLQPGDFCHPDGLSFEECRRFVADAQHWLRTHTRHGIPALVMEECLSGADQRGATVYPQMLALASTWRPELCRDMAERIRAYLEAQGAHAGISPVLDLGRDPRMGRVEETFGEDPALASAFGVAYVEGLQGSDLKKGVAATGKHFLGQGGNLGGHFPGAVQAGPRELRHVWAAPFEAAVRQAGLRLVMHGYHEIDGLPCAVNRGLLTDLLRDRLGFDGVVVSDYFALKHLRDMYFIAEGPEAAVSAALRAGVDAELPDGRNFRELLEGPRRASAELRARVGLAAERVMALKRDLGLLDGSRPSPSGRAPDPVPERALARRIALEGMVLLENRDGLLPLDPERVTSMAVVGPLADDPTCLGGDYAWASAHRWQKQPLKPGDAPGDSLWTCLSRFARSRNLRCRLASAGTVHGSSAAQIRRAVEVAGRSRVTVVVLGDLAGVTCGEGKDSKTLAPPGDQLRLLEAVAATGTRVVTVLVCGRPWCLERIAALSDALLFTGYPGQEGGAALVDLLFGAAAPTGRLPVSFPKSVGHVPCPYDRHDFTGHGFQDVAYPFGYGLGYSTVTMELVEAPERGSARKGIDLVVRLRNTGSRRDAAVAQMYTRLETFPCARPPRRLVAFHKQELEPGESRDIRFHLSGDLLAEPDPDGRLLLPPGRLRLMLGSNARDLHGEREVLLTGPAATFVHREHFFGSAEVL